MTLPLHPQFYPPEQRRYVFTGHDAAQFMRQSRNMCRRRQTAAREAVERGRKLLAQMELKP